MLTVRVCTETWAGFAIALSLTREGVGIALSLTREGIGIPHGAEALVSLT